MKALNLTQHPATEVQISQGVVEPCQETKSRIKRLLTVDRLPSADDVQTSARALALIARNYSSAMIGGAPWLMPALHSTLLNVGVEPVYAFSLRVSEERVGPDGEVTKVNVFKHLGFVSLSGELAR